MKSMMLGKKVFAVALSTVLAVSLLLLSGCGNTVSGVPAAGGKPQIIATVFASYDFARQVAGDDADVKMLVPPGSETHSFEPTPQDIIALSGCDMFIYVGGESDVWVEELLASVNNSDMVVIKMIDCVNTVEEDVSILADPAMAEEGHEGHAHEEGGEGHEGEEAAHGGEETQSAHEEEHGVIDEHVWTSLRNAAIIVQTISDELCTIDADNRLDYEKRTSEYCGKLTDLDNEIKTVVAEGQRSLLVFGDRFPFRYFIDDYALECKAAFPGCSTATEASALTVTNLVDTVRTEGIPVVLYRELSDHKIADAIAAETGVVTMELHSCHNITQNDFDGGASYLSLMEKNAETLRAALA
ncbi:MAG TPA: zinc ABC transporter substrate-binding protein [Coriobacteriia bacterium]|nr:zinc ABC transporter substrate-binding protein [Coriobacteriia bacterium]